MKLSDDTKFAILLLVVMVSLIMTVWQPKHEVAVFYDCRVAEISPDIPLKVKEQCRHVMEKH